MTQQTTLIDNEWRGPAFRAAAFNGARYDLISLNSHFDHRLFYPNGSATEADNLAVSYTHLDVYKRQIYLRNNATEFLFATITDNTAVSGDAGGVYIDGLNGELFLGNSILAGNSDSATGGVYPDCFNGTETLTYDFDYNLIGNDAGCLGFFLEGNTGNVESVSYTHLTTATSLCWNWRRPRRFVRPRPPGCPSPA